MEQLILPLQLNAQATFATFMGEKNKTVVTQLQAALENSHPERLFFLWGNRGSGRSHLLQACCHAAIVQHKQVFYLPLTQYKKLHPSILENLEDLDLVCLDDIHMIAGQAGWEEALFHCYNRLTDQNKVLIMSGDSAPAHSAIQLADLRSRLAAGYVFQLQPLSDHEKLQVLQNQATALGLLWSTEFGEFMLQRCSRDLTELINAFDQLANATLQQQRRLTIPFIKQVLSI